MLVLPVYGDKDQGLGLLVSVFSKNAGKSSWFNPSLLKNILMPAVELIGENLRLRGEMSTVAEVAEMVDKELKLVYQVDEKIHGTSRSHASLAQLVSDAI